MVAPKCFFFFFSYLYLHENTSVICWDVKKEAECHYN